MVSLFWYYTLSIFPLFFIISAYFMSLIPCFLVEFSLLTSLIIKKNCRQNAKRSKKAYLIILTVFVEEYAFWSETELSRLCGLSFLSVLYAIYPMTIDPNCFPKTYRSSQLKISVYSCLF